MNDKILIVVMPGHFGNKDTGASNGSIKEDTLTLMYSKLVYDKLSPYFKNILYGNDPELMEMDIVQKAKWVGAKANAFSGPVICLDCHLNAFNGTARGVETIHSIHSKPDLARAIAESIAELGLPFRRVFSKESTATKNTDYFAMHKYTGKAQNIIIEPLFMDNPEDLKIMNSDGFWDKLATKIALGLLKYLDMPVIETAAKNLILGQSIATVEQMRKFLFSINPKATDVCQIFLDEGEIEGVRGDVAFCQACKETNYFRFNGQAKAKWNNPAGLGVTGAKDSTGEYIGNKFPDLQIGIRAQIQHLKGYASKEPLNSYCVDQRYSLLTHGIAPYWEDLNGKWAVPGTTYGQDIINMWQKLITIEVLKIEVDTTDWKQKYLDLKVKIEKIIKEG